jgi:hypothetical protein
MPQVPYCRIEFDLPLQWHQLRFFRGALLANAPADHPLLHQHTEADQLLYQYPLVQYKRIGGRAALVGLGTGAELLPILLDASQRGSLNLNGQEVQAPIRRISTRTFRIQRWDTPIRYHIQHWAAFNAQNLAEYHAAPNEAAQNRILSRVLRNNIIALAKSLDWWIEGELTVHWLHTDHEGQLSYKDVQRVVLSGVFEANVSLPPFISLGRHSSHGFGVLNFARREEPELEAEMA